MRKPFFRVVRRNMLDVLKTIVFDDWEHSSKCPRCQQYVMITLYHYLGRRR